ncbi:MAG: hypothetical protein AAF830_15555 [Pseudomonadota bacterium]
MNSIAGWGRAMVLATTAFIHPQESSADGFTGADFARWSIESQDSYIQTSMTMAGVVFTRTEPQIATCINDWYFSGDRPEARNETIRGTITRHLHHHPAGVILAMILEECPER